MAVYLYLSLIPEALVASMLSPMDFGAYFAVGTEKKARGQAMFFSVDRGFSSDYFPLSEIDSRCVPHAKGEPKRSVYLSVYRVLEHVPLSAIGGLYLTTRDGRVLEIAPTRSLPTYPRAYRMYQEICPQVLEKARGIALAFGMTVDDVDLTYLEHAFEAELWWNHIRRHPLRFG